MPDASTRCPTENTEGTVLSDIYPDTRWRYEERHETEHQWFADKVTELVDRLKPHKAFLREVSSTSGRGCILVQFLGGGYLGDEIPRDALSALADLGLDLGIECFMMPQSVD